MFKRKCDICRNKKISCYKIMLFDNGLDIYYYCQNCGYVLVRNFNEIEKEVVSFLENLREKIKTKKKWVKNKSGDLF